MSLGILLLFGGLLRAQHYRHSVGIRAGVPYGITYKRILKERRAYEVFAATRWDGGIAFGGFYLQHFDPDIYPGLLLFGGAGPDTGFWNDNSPYITGPGAGWSFGLAATVGAEYEFDDIPLAVGLDWLPLFNLVQNTVFDAGRVGVSLRYLF